jgi:hypothetical protein
MASTGLRLAALAVCQVTERIAIPVMISAVTIKIHADGEAF